MIFWPFSAVVPLWRKLWRPQGKKVLRAQLRFGQFLPYGQMLGTEVNHIVPWWALLCRFHRDLITKTGWFTTINCKSRGLSKFGLKQKVPLKMGYGTFLGNTGTSRERENPYPRWLMVCNELSCPQSHIHQCVITQTPQTHTNIYKLTHMKACACSVNTRTQKCTQTNTHINSAQSQT